MLQIMLHIMLRTGSQGMAFRLPERTIACTFLQNAQIGAGAHPASYSAGIDGSFSGSKSSDA
jgi:hypothetical protein